MLFLIAAALATVGDTYDATAQFMDEYSGSETPWTYATAQAVGSDRTPTTASTYLTLPSRSWSGSPLFPLAIYNNTSNAVDVASGTKLQPERLLLHPAQDGSKSVLEFAAPTAACYQLDLEVTLLDNDAGSVDVTLYAAETNLFSQPLSGAGATAEASTDSLFLSEDEPVGLYVGYGSNSSFVNDALETHFVVTQVSDGVDTDGDGVLDACPGDCDDDGIVDPVDEDRDLNGDGACEPRCAADEDDDGVCDDVDGCVGDNTTGDYDRDGICNDRDACRGGSLDAAQGTDSDQDGVCDELDACEGNDTYLDLDQDLVCDAEDMCWGNNATGDSDGDGWCDGTLPPTGGTGSSPAECSKGGAILAPLGLLGLALAVRRRRRTLA